MLIACPGQSPSSSPAVPLPAHQPGVTAHIIPTQPIVTTRIFSWTAHRQEELQASSSTTAKVKSPGGVRSAVQSNEVFASASRRKNS